VGEQALPNTSPQERSIYFFQRFRKYGCEQFMRKSTNRGLKAKPVEFFSTSRPIKYFAVKLADEDRRLCQQFG
jgi:hypothetical protein